MSTPPSTPSELDEILDDCFYEENFEGAKKEAIAKIEALISASNRESRIDELEMIKDFDESANYNQDGKDWTGLAIPRNKILRRIATLKSKAKEQ